MTFEKLQTKILPIEIHGSSGILLRSPTIDDYDQWKHVREQSRDFLAPWEPIWPEDDLTRAAFKRRIQRYNKERLADQAYAFFIFVDEGKTLVGAINLSRVQRGVAHSGGFGYWIGAPFASRGYMTNALRAAIHYAFNILHLERLEAATLPHNFASMAVLKKNGFQEEGLARGYLQIAGQRQDHKIFGLLKNDPRT